MISFKNTFAKTTTMIALALLCHFPIPTLASEDITLDIFRPFVSTSFQRSPEKLFKDSEAVYTNREFSIDATIPLGKTTMDSSGSLASQYFITTHLNYWYPNISFLNSEHRFYQGRLNFAGLFIPHIDHLFAISAGASIAEDEKTLSNPELRPAVLGLGLYRNSSSLSYIYGLAYSYAFGRGYLFPVLGLQWQLNPTWSFSTLLPAFVKFTQQINPDFKLGYQFTITGNRTRFYNDGDFLDQSDILYVSDVAGKISVDANYTLSSSILLFGELGLLGGRKLIFAEGNNQFQENDIEYSSLIKIGIRYIWGDNLLTQQSPTNF